MSKPMTYGEFMGLFRPTYPKAGWKFPADYHGMYVVNDAGGVWIPLEEQEQDDGQSTQAD